jgi:hypothetical protein
MDARTNANTLSRTLTVSMSEYTDHARTMGVASFVSACNISTVPLRCRVDEPMDLRIQKSVLVSQQGRLILQFSERERERESGQSVKQHHAKLGR